MRTEAPSRSARRWRLHALRSGAAGGAVRRTGVAVPPRETQGTMAALPRAARLGALRPPVRQRFCTAAVAHGPRRRPLTALDTRSLLMAPGSVASSAVAGWHCCRVAGRPFSTGGTEDTADGTEGSTRVLFHSSMCALCPTSCAEPLYPRLTCLPSVPLRQAVAGAGPDRVRRGRHGGDSCIDGVHGQPQRQNSCGVPAASIRRVCHVRVRATASPCLTALDTHAACDVSD